jgi:hypothetical protein
MKCSLTGDTSKDSSYQSVEFFKDQKQRLIGSFWLHSTINDPKTALVAF